jgi:four helix bundle protein
MIRGFRDLEVWRKGMNLALDIYKATESFPRGERFGLVVQLRRASVSIPSNIAEGKAIGGNSYPRHVKIALGSEAELQTQIELAKELKMIGDSEAEALLARVSELGRMLVALLNSLPRT